MDNWVVREAKYVARRRHKLGLDDLVGAPKFALSSFVSNTAFGELERSEMISEYPTWRYGSPGELDPSFLTETQDARRGISIEDVNGTIDLPQPFVSKIGEGESKPLFLGGPTPLSLTPDGRIIREIVKNNRSQINALLEPLLPFDWLPVYWKLRFGSLSLQGHLDADILPLFQRKYPNYYHWLMDELPKLRAIDHYPGEVTIGLEPDLPSYVTESLEYLGFTDYVHIDETPVTADSILAVSNRTPRFVNLSYVDDEYVSWLRERVLDRARDPSRTERIYVSRENSAAREVVNRDALLAELRKLGFESYALEERSFKDNVELFANAEIIVGPHGAGLTDIVFADDTAVVELNTLSAPQPSFYLLAQQLGHEYRHVTCPPVDEAEYNVQRNMRADVGMVLDVVRTIL